MVVVVAEEEEEEEDATGEVEEERAGQMMPRRVTSVALAIASSASSFCRIESRNLDV